MAILPVAPRAGAEPIRVLVRAIKGARGESVRLPPLILNDAHGKPTPAAEAVLREGQSLTLMTG
jgi:tRNA1(Val) A37 N6-methylase TrmN6